MLTSSRIRYCPAPRDVLERVNDADVEWLTTLPVAAPSGETGLARLDELERGLFRHLNAAVAIGHESPDWQLGPRVGNRLWIITLHYQQWLYELARIVREGDPADRRRAGQLLRQYLSDWLSQCELSQPGAAALANNSYAIATRLGWWVRAFGLVGKEFRRQQPELVNRWVTAIWCQAEHLSRHVEWDLRANHLLRDAVGLAWASRFFCDAASRRWERTANRIAVDQTDEQVLADGGHFERSPMYHLEVMGDFLSLAHLLRDDVSRSRMRQTWARMAECARCLRHPDGALAQFNDGSRRNVADALQLGASIGCNVELAPPRGLQSFAEFGMVVWQGDPWTVFFDVGAIGPDCQPGHAHADTLSLECSYRGRRLFVDPGCYGYDHDERRRYDRSTSAHNTLCVDGQDSSEMWHIFRVGRRARPRQLQVRSDSSSFCAQASHTGYDHLPGHPRHTRTLTLSAGQVLEIRDQLAGHGDHQVVWSWLLEPIWSATRCDGGWELQLDDVRLRVHVEGPPSLRLAITRSPLHPDYGVEIETTRLECAYHGSLPIQLITRLEEA